MTFWPKYFRCRYDMPSGPMEREFLVDLKYCRQGYRQGHRKQKKTYSRYGGFCLLDILTKPETCITHSSAIITYS